MYKIFHYLFNKCAPTVSFKIVKNMLNSRKFVTTCYNSRLAALDTLQFCKIGFGLLNIE